jgi:ribosomal protein S18 acetylase RimI-like enzyme
MNITVGAISDLTALVALKDACVAQMRSAGIEQWDEVYPSPATIGQDIEAASLHVLRIDGDIAGCMTLDEKKDPLWKSMDWRAVTGAVAAVHRVMVHPTQQGRGLAKQLMTHAESLARERRYAAIHLDAFSLNPTALALYDRLGYRRTGTAMMRKGPFICFEKIL